MSLPHLAELVHQVQPPASGEFKGRDVAQLLPPLLARSRENHHRMYAVSKGGRKLTIVGREEERARSSRITIEL